MIRISLYWKASGISRPQGLLDVVEHGVAGAGSWSSYRLCIGEPGWTISGENRRLIPVANAAGLTQDRTPEGLAHPETCRPIYSRSTATAGVAARFTQQLLKPE
jgi:hypothetical protein